MENKLFYPAIFHPAEEGGFWVSFPDLPECLTQGDDMTEAYEMAVDALGLCLTDIVDHKGYLPVPSSPDTVKIEDNGFLVVVEFDMAAYRRKQSTKLVKKNLTIPEWLNEAALAKNINFSQVLQEALLEKLNQPAMRN